MESKVHRGRRGERLAAEWLEARGWRILDRNWRDGPRELDLVVMRRGIVAFVEVKTRSSDSFGSPFESIHHRKRREIERAARRWIRVRADECSGIRGFRFDAFAVRLRPEGGHVCRHLEGAWRTGE